MPELFPSYVIISPPNCCLKYKNSKDFLVCVVGREKEEKSLGDMMIGTRKKKLNIPTHRKIAGGHHKSHVFI
jgi:hypothetical protein